MSTQIDVFSARSDNFGYLVHDPQSGVTVAIDAPEEKAIRAALARRGWTLTDIVITHHHADHTEAIAPLKSAFGATVTGPRAEADRIAGLDRLVEPGEMVKLGAMRFEVLGVPGHTAGHVAYHDAAARRLFCGDALFSLGCGRMFEGEPVSMWAGLAALRALPDDTKIYCGHEYTAANARFALSVDPDNVALMARAAEVEEQRRAGRFTIPAMLGTEKRANPFLRADQPVIAGAVGKSGQPPEEVFAALRAAKDRF